MKDYLWQVTIAAHTRLREMGICPQETWEKKEVPSKLFWRFLAFATLEGVEGNHTVEQVCAHVFPRAMFYREGCFKLDGWNDAQIQNDHRKQWRAMVASILHCAAKRSDEELASMLVKDPDRLRAIVVTNMLDT